MTPQKNVLLLIGLTLSIVGLSFSNSPPAVAAHSMVPFSSQTELQTFIKEKSLYCGQPDLLSGNGRYAPGNLLQFSAETSSSTPSYSETNNQVAGVDELDTVKTDGFYIYTANNNNLTIVRAYPASEAAVVTTISVNGTIVGLFVHGDKLAIIGQATQYWTEPIGAEPVSTIQSSRFAPGPSYSYLSSLTAWVYDIEARESPVLRMTIAIEGSFVGARMIGDFVYLVASQYVYCGQEIELPRQVLNDNLVLLSPTNIYHSDMEDNSHTFTNILAFDISRDGQNASFESFLLGSSSTIYVSTRALYLTSPSWAEDATVIHRISLDQETIRYEVTGDVPGHVLNQFSMDEYGEFFRVATHTYNQQFGIMLRSQPRTTVTVAPTGDSMYGPGSNVYVLDRDLKIIGRIEGLGQGETFHSARFMGERAYLVTFKKIDPLFVVDLQDPTNPTLLGELKVPGYSDYLQPYDETHLIGIGKDADDQGSFAWYQGVKVSLFDVSDPENPKESGSFIIGDRGTDSPALYEHKAVLFDKDRNLLVIPVTVVEKLANQTEPWAYGYPVFQGAYVFSISPEAGVEFRGGITHLQSGEVPYYGYTYDRMISRSLFIDNVLYTLSSSMIKMNNLDGLSEIGSVSF